MALMPGFDTRSAAAVAGQVAQEQLQARAQDIQQEQFEAGLIQRDQEMALQAFQAQQQIQMQRMQQQRLARQSANEAALRQTKLALETGIKFDPASKQYRPLTEEDAEFNPWRERQAERKAKLPLSPDAQVNLAREKAQIGVAADIAVEEGRQRVRAPFKQAEFERETLRRFDESKERARAAMDKFEKELIFRDLRDMRLADQQVELAKARGKMTLEAIKLRHRLGAPERALKALTAKQKAEETRRDRTYNRTFSRYMRASEDVRQETEKRNKMDRKLWPEFKKQFSTAPWFSSNFTPSREDIGPGGKLANEWNKFLLVPNQNVARAQEILKKALADFDRASNVSLGNPVRAAQPAPEMPSGEVGKALIKKHKGDVKAAMAEWAKMRKAQ